MGGCSAPNCKNRPEKGFRVFRFPANKERRQRWIINCKRAKWAPTYASVLCEVHFEESQFEQRRLDGHHKLKPNAVPTIFDVPNSAKLFENKRQLPKKYAGEIDENVSYAKKDISLIHHDHFYASYNNLDEEDVNAIKLEKEDPFEDVDSSGLKVEKEVCCRHFQTNPIQLGGPEIIVQMNEFSCLKNKHKSHGERSREPVWILGLVDTSTQPVHGYMEIVNMRDSATLFPIIHRVVRPGSIIYTPDWQAYRSIQGLDQQHISTSDSIDFQDSKTEVDTQVIESYWDKHKSHIKVLRGVRRQLLHSYIQEFMWRDRYAENAFEHLCKHIASQFLCEPMVANLLCDHKFHSQEK